MSRCRRDLRQGGSRLRRSGLQPDGSRRRDMSRCKRDLRQGGARLRRSGLQPDGSRRRDVSRCKRDLRQGVLACVGPVCNRTDPGDGICHVADVTYGRTVLACVGPVCNRTDHVDQICHVTNVTYGRRAIPVCVGPVCNRTDPGDGMEYFAISHPRQFGQQTPIAMGLRPIRRPHQAGHGSDGPTRSVSQGK
jgi:hypothetical protein